MRSKTVIVFLALLFSAPASWAQKTFITIQASGVLITSGEASAATFGNGDFDLSDYTDVISYNLQLSRAVSGITPAGGPVAGPITIVKSIGPSSVSLRQAWNNNEQIDATIIFFLPDPANPAQSIEAYQVVLSGGVIVALKSWQNVTPSSNALLESVTIAFQSFEWTHPPTGANTTHTFGTGL